MRRSRAGPAVNRFPRDPFSPPGMIRSHTAPLALLAAALVAPACAPASGHQPVGVTPRRSPAGAAGRRIDSLPSLMALGGKLGQLNPLSRDGDTGRPPPGGVIR